MEIEVILKEDGCCWVLKIGKINSIRKDMMGITMLLKSNSSVEGTRVRLDADKPSVVDKIHQIEETWINAKKLTKEAEDDNIDGSEEVAGDDG